MVVAELILKEIMNLQDVNPAVEEGEPDADIEDDDDSYDDEREPNNERRPDPDDEIERWLDCDLD